MAVCRTFDLETTIKSSFKRKANPFDPDNWTVAGAFKDALKNNLKAVYYESKAESHADSKTWLELFDGADVLVGQNIKFDILRLIQNRTVYIAYRKWVAEGGRIWDIQLAEYLLAGMSPSSHMLSLDELAERYGGDFKVDEVKTLWEAGVDTPDIERDLLMRYLCGDENTLGDIGNTEKVFLAQVKKAKANGQLKSIQLNMDSMLYTIEAEYNGLYVDQELGHKLAVELAGEIERVEAELKTHLPKDLPFEFNFASRKQLSALIYGGDVAYTIAAPQFNEQGESIHPLMTVKAVKWGDYYIIENDFNLIGEQDYLRTWSEVEGKLQYNNIVESQTVTPERYSGGQKKGQLKTKNFSVYDYSKPQKTLNCTFAYTFPRQCTPKPDWKTSDEGIFKTGADIITELSVTTDVPFLKALNSLSAMRKDLGTYFITYDDDGTAKGMLSLVNKHGVIHHMLNHTSTVTGRFSASNPNSQNIPKGQKSKVKQVFVSRFKGGKIIQSDFSSLEIYIQAILTMCVRLIEELRKGTDMHCLRLSVKEGMSYEEVFNLCKVICDEVWDYKRTGAKVFSFQRAYGAGAAKISETTGIPYDEVLALIEAESKLFPEIDAYFEERTKQIEKSAHSVGDIQPHPQFPMKTVDLRQGYSHTPDGKRYSYRQGFAPEYVVRRQAIFSCFSPTEIKNYEVQGSGAEFAKAGMALSVRAFYKLDNFNDKALLINQVHDAEYADAAPDVAIEAAALLHVCMEEASPYMEKLFNWPLPVYVPSDTTYGDSMAEDKKLPKDEFQAAVAKFKPFVKSIYESK